jgi:hypothetical protein
LARGVDRVFLDANVLFSAAYRLDSGLLILWSRPDTALLTSAHAVEEARRNLSADDQRQRLNGLVRKCEIVATPTVAGLSEGLDRTHFGPYYGRTIAGVLILPPSAYLRG